MASNEPRWHSEALEEAKAARDWYAARSAFAAHGFLLALEAALEAVVTAPDRYPLTVSGCRKYVFPNRYPFNLVYRTVADGTLEILAIASQWRKPQYWRSRT